MGDWTYEAKDFLTPAPYEALYQFHGQPFVHETKLQELSVYAASQGFRGFKSMYKKYIESLKAQAGTVYVDNVTNFTGQPWSLTRETGTPLTWAYTAAMGLRTSWHAPTPSCQWSA